MANSYKLNGRQLSTGVRAKTPSSPKFNPNSSNSFKEMQEKKNMYIWNAISNKDYENYIKEQETKKIKRKEQQDNMRGFLDKQVKESEFKKTINNKMLASGKDHKYKSLEYDEMLHQMKKYDEKATEKFLQRKQQLEDQVRTNLEQTKRKQDMKIFDRSQDLIMDSHYQTSFQKTAKILDTHHNYDLMKVKDERKKQMMQEISTQENLKTTSKVLSKIDHVNQMNSEYDLMMKNQDRYKKKIKELVKRNDMIYNNVKNSPYKNLAIAEKERENKILMAADQSYQNESIRKNREYEEKTFKKQKELLELGSTHK